MASRGVGRPGMGIGDENSVEGVRGVLGALMATVEGRERKGERGEGERGKGKRSGRGRKRKKEGGKEKERGGSCRGSRGVNFQVAAVRQHCGARGKKAVNAVEGVL